MPVISNGVSSYNETSKRSYIATATFTTFFYTYTSARNGNNQLVYTLAQNPTATDALCKAGHVLKENGRKIVFGANNIDVNTTSTLVTANNTPYYLIGVFDSVSFLSGFIDPNASVFAPYNTNLPNFISRSVGVTGPDGTTNDMGSSVYTSGTVTAQGGIVTNAGNVGITNGNIVVSTPTTAGLGKIIVPSVVSAANPVVAGNAMAGRLTLNGATPIVVNTTAVTANSLIFLTRNATGGTNGFFWVSAQTAGTSFAVTGTASDTSTVNWMIIN